MNYTQTFHSEELPVGSCVHLFFVYKQHNPFTSSILSWGVDVSMCFLSLYCNLLLCPFNEKK